jgi:anthranilate phosphoribosyltransferase
MNEIYKKTIKLLSPNLSEQERETLFLEVVESKTNPENLFAVVSAIRGKMRPIALPFDSVDTCGTGGSGYQTINTSTLSSLLLAACGYFSVTKHGGRSASGNCGSADIMERLGINLIPDEKTQIRAFLETKFAFFFSGHHHRTMASIAGLRKKYGKPTIFNLAGPLCNPCSPKKQIIGTNSVENAEIITKTLVMLGGAYCIVFTSDSGLDEIAFEPFTFFRISGKYIYKEKMNSLYPPVDLEKISGGNLEFNRQIFMSVLSGQKTIFSEMVIINAAYALFFLAGMNYDKAYNLAKEALHDRAALDIFKKYKAALS